jgi:hypothetical protein
MRRSCVIFALFLWVALVPEFALGAVEADVLDQVGKKIEQYPVIRAEFTQTKLMQALKRPLITTGQLTYSRSHGLLWQIFQPFHVSYVLGEEKVVEIDANGLRKERGVRDLPGLAQIGKVFRAMLSADASALHTYFDVTAQGDSDKWQLILKPRQQQISKSLSLIELSGSQFVETILMNEARGDTTTITFRKTHGATVLSDSESQLFGTPALSKQAAP